MTSVEEKPVLMGMQPQDIGLIAVAGDVTIAPDGTRAAYTVRTVDLEDNRYRTRLWVVSLDGSPPELFEIGTGDPVAGAMPRWSPDGSRLAWVSPGPGSSRTINVSSPEGGAGPTIVCTWPDDITELSWAPTGDRLAFVGRARDEERYGPDAPTRAADMPPRRITRLMNRFDGIGWIYDRPCQVHVVAADGSAAPVALTGGQAPAGGVAWSPDGRHLTYVAARHATWDVDGVNDIWVVAASGGESERLTDTTASWAAPAWCPEGHRIAALMKPSPRQPRYGELWVLDVASRQPTRWGAGLDLNFAPLGWTQPPQWVGAEIVTGVDDRGGLHLHAIPDPAQADQATSRTVVGGERVVTSFDIAAGMVAFTASAVDQPGELWAVEAGGGAAWRVSDHSSALSERAELVGLERFSATSGDGTEVECWAMRPTSTAEDQRHPTVLNIHGGRVAQYGYEFSDDFQMQVGAGFGVIFCNPRGSSGYSSSFARAIRWPEAAVDPGSGWGSVDYQDVLACAEEAARRFDWVDANRLGVQGGSYGGYLTAWVVGHTDRFRAAIAERGVYNLATIEETSDISGLFRSDYGVSHLERPDLYAARSPITYAAAMKTPLLLIHGENDLRCPISQAEELFMSLRLTGHQAELVRFPGETHALTRAGSPNHRVMRADIVLDWLRRHLLGDEDRQES